MSKTFQIKNVDGKNVTINAAQVSHIIDNIGGVSIVMSNGFLIETTASTYRSVRGYLAKALDGSSQADE